MNPTYRRVTIAQLFAHVSGMPYMPRTEEPDEFRNITHDLMARRYEYVKAAVRDEPEAAPGTKVVYSGGPIIVATMAERATHQSWESLMRRYVFKPLGMKHSGFGAMSEADRITGPWEHLLQDGKLVPVTPDPAYAEEPHAPAGRNVYCSAGDLARFMAAHLPDPHPNPRLLSPKMLHTLQTPVGDSGFCPGWTFADVDWGGGRILWHNGSNGKNYAVANVAPRKNSAYCVLTNVAGDKAEAACEAMAAEFHRMFAQVPNHDLP
jgi:CubicO group peptidase (beta-lactamase class C family)